ncbi:hypothetical protein C7974DRAFT_318139, partial [Boeremia exigua]|uniref:uncharacterized protein n=1 Tax=Boeremia exigua TaxID=749465 RepID=UPI001E8DBA27
IRPANLVMLFTDVGQWISQRVRSLFVTPPGLGAFTLPVEIILMISSHLDITSRLSLALTCRTLFLVCFPKYLTLHPVEKEELLLLIERDLSTYYFCHFCVKLHRWHGSWTRSMNMRDSLPCPGEPGTTLFHPSGHYIPYYHARLVMNRNLYGPKYGPSLRSLEHRNRSHHTSDRVIKASSRYGHIVDNQLLLLCITSYSHSNGNAALLRKHINHFRYSVCRHITVAPGSPDHGPVGVPELAEPKTASSHFSPCSQGLGSCSICLTDYTVDVTWQDDRRGYLITLSIYNQLGDCRSPSAWEWRTMASPYASRDEILRKDRSVEYGLGCVRDRWNRATGVVAEAKGDWVPLPRMLAESRGEH